MNKVYIDTETCGLHSMPVLLQYAFDDGPIELYNIWMNPVEETIALLDTIASKVVVGFNLKFDWFHLVKLRTIWSLLPGDWYPDEHIQEIYDIEPQGRDVECFKPAGALDLMLHARKTEFQSTMERSDIRIRRVPTSLAWELAKELNDRVALDPILFARAKLAPRFKVLDRQVNGKMCPDFKDILLKFRPSTALKALAVHALGVSPREVTTFSDIEVPKIYLPEELGYRPFGGTWNKVIKKHIEHWAFHDQAREYARNDVKYTRMLDAYFGHPEPNDDDSILACMVASVRWRGYAIDVEGIKAMKQKVLEQKARVPTSPRYVRKYIEPFLSEDEKVVTQGSTKKAVLETIGNSGLFNEEAAKRAREVLQARLIDKEIELFDKLLKAGRLHPDFKVIGTLSSRMAGDSGFNMQGVKRTKEVRQLFKIAFGHLVLKGGDFEAFEVVLADSVYNDPDLRRDLITCEQCRDVQFVKGKCPKCGGNKALKIHALFGMHVYPGMTYDEIKATQGTEMDLYTRSKSAVFAMIYGGEGYTLMTRLGVPLETAEAAYQRFLTNYKQVGISRQRIIKRFSALHQPGGIGTAIAYREPDEFVESLFGFRRYFTLENKIIKALFELARKPPSSWKDVRVKVMRSDRVQSAMGAVQSALYGAAFQIQGSNIRAAANHEIQSSGANITKMLQRRIWDLQPAGFSEWIVQPSNVHDEILCPVHPDHVDKLNKVIDGLLDDVRPKVPLIGIDWGDMQSWAD